MGSQEGKGRRGEVPAPPWLEAGEDGARGKRGIERECKREQSVSSCGS